MHFILSFTALALFASTTPASAQENSHVYDESSSYGCYAPQTQKANIHPFPREMAEHGLDVFTSACTRTPLTTDRFACVVDYAPCAQYRSYHSKEVLSIHFAVKQTAWMLAPDRPSAAAAAEVDEIDETELRTVLGLILANCGADAEDGGDDAGWGGWMEVGGQRGYFLWAGWGVEHALQRDANATYRAVMDGASRNECDLWGSSHGEMSSASHSVATVVSTKTEEVVVETGVRATAGSMALTSPEQAVVATPTAMLVIQGGNPGL